MALFIEIVVDPKLAGDVELRKQLVESCPVDIFEASKGALEIVDKNLDGEDGFEVYVVKDATAGPRHPELGDGYASALVNFGYIANGVVSTEEAVSAIAGAS